MAQSSSAAAAAAPELDPYFIELAKSQVISEAENQKGNTAYQNGQFALAIDFYTAAIRASGNTPKYYSNRSAAHVKVVDWENALADGQKASCLDPFSVKYCTRVLYALKGLERVEQAKFLEWDMAERWAEQLKSQPLDLRPSRVVVDIKTTAKDIVKMGGSPSPLPELAAPVKLDQSTWFLFASAPNPDFCWWRPFELTAGNLTDQDNDNIFFAARFLIDAFMLDYLDGKNENELSTSRFYSFLVVAQRVGLLPGITIYALFDYLALYLVVRGRKLAEMQRFWKETRYDSPYLLKTMQQLRSLILGVPRLTTEDMLYGMPAERLDFDRLPTIVDTSFNKILAAPECTERILHAFEKRYRAPSQFYSTRDLIDLTVMCLQRFIFFGHDGVLEVQSLMQYIKFKLPAHAWAWVMAVQLPNCVDVVDSYSRWVILLHHYELLREPSFVEAVYEVIVDHAACVSDDNAPHPKYDNGFGVFVAKFKAKKGTALAIELVTTLQKNRHCFALPKGVLDKALEVLLHAQKTHT